MYFVYLTTF